jgi:LysR family transcriptional regulator, glycine cleavage system transcriptional activator
MKAPVHLNALRAFEASARHQSFSGAAKELNVTPAAVGQLVRTLEEWLNAPLFHRVNKGRARLVPTAAAERSLPDIRAGFDRLALGLEQLKEQSKPGQLTVTVSPAFAAKWLLPRLDDFQLAHPDMDVRLDTSLEPADFATHGVDIGVRYGSGLWAGLTAEKLMDEEIYPVCSPSLLRNRRSLKEPQDLLREVLIHDLSMEGHEGFPTWEAWLRHSGVKGRATLRSMKINNSAAVLQAAAEGQGVALARSVMARDDIAQKRLVRLFPKIVFASPLAYFVVCRHECSSLPRLAAFREWLISQAS